MSDKRKNAPGEDRSGIYEMYVMEDIQDMRNDPERDKAPCKEEPMQEVCPMAGTPMCPMMQQCPMMTQPQAMPMHMSNTMPMHMNNTMPGYMPGTAPSYFMPDMTPMEMDWWDEEEMKGVQLKQWDDEEDESYDSCSCSEDMVYEKDFMKNIYTQPFYMKKKHKKKHSKSKRYWEDEE